MVDQDPGIIQDMLFKICVSIIFINMSILEDYSRHAELLGDKVISAIDDYIEEMSKNGYETSYSHVIYNEKEFEIFKK